MIDQISASPLPPPSTNEKISAHISDGRAAKGFGLGSKGRRMNAPAYVAYGRGFSRIVVLIWCSQTMNRGRGRNVPGRHTSKVLHM